VAITSTITVNDTLKHGSYCGLAGDCHNALMILRATMVRSRKGLGRLGSRTEVA
jgi:hypothetical protein